MEKSAGKSIYDDMIYGTGEVIERGTIKAFEETMTLKVKGSKTSVLIVGSDVVTLKKIILDYNKYYKDKFNMALLVCNEDKNMIESDINISSGYPGKFPIMITPDDLYIVQEEPEIYGEIAIELKIKDTQKKIQQKSGMNFHKSKKYKRYF